MPHSIPADALKDIAIGTGMTAGLFAASLLSPLLGIFATVAIPLPTLYYRLKLGRKRGAAVPVCAGMLLLPAAGGIGFELLIFVALVLLGLLLGELLPLQLSVESTVVGAAGVTLIAVAILLLGISAVQSVSPAALLNDYVRLNLEFTLAVYESAGVPAENVQAIAGAMDAIQYVLVRVLPAMAAAALLFLCWTTLLLVRPLLQRHGLRLPFGGLNRWRAPDFLVWGAIGCGAALLVPAQWMKLAGANGLLVLMMIYFFQGIAIIAFYFEKKRFPKPLRVLLYSLIALQQVVLLAVVVLGFFDVWANFRKLDLSSAA